MATTYPIVSLNILGETITFSGKDVIEAEVTQEIHPVGIEVPASSARIRVWLDDTPIIVQAEGSMVVEGAGRSFYNGTYAVDGTYGGKPKYSKKADTITGYTHIVWALGQWNIGLYRVEWNDHAIVLASAYVSGDSVATPDLCTTWTLSNAGELPVPTVSISEGITTSLREKFSPFSDGEYYQAMSTGLAIDISEQVDETEHPIGRFYLEEWNNPMEGELELVCTDAIGTLENKRFLGNFYETPTLVASILSGILGDVGILYSVDINIANKLLKGYIPGDITLREALQQVLFACGAYAVTSGDSHIKIKASVLPESSFSGEDIDVVIADEEKTDSQKVNILPIVTGVEIMSHDYSKGDVLETIFSAYLTPGDYMVVYPKPYWYVQATGTGDAITYLATTNNDPLVTPDSPDGVPITAVGVTVYTIYGAFDFGVNYVYLHVPEPGGTAVVSGKPWLDATQIFSWANDNASHAQPNVWKINDATLVPSIQTSTEEIVPNVLERVASYASLRYQHQVKLFPRTDVDLGNIALADSLYGKDVVGIVEKMSSSLSGGYLIETELIGTEHTEE